MALDKNAEELLKEHESPLDDLDLTLDDDSTKLLKELAAPIVGSVMATAAVAAAVAIITKLVVTNYKRNDLTGDTEMKPTDDDVAISKVESSASGVDAALSKDEVTGVDGDLSAAQTEALALTGEATALESGAAAARTKAGAADIETKGLKMT